jgi:hypothetical protein
VKTFIGKLLKYRKRNGNYPYAEYSRSYYLKNKESFLLKSKESRIILRKLVISFYGGKCQCCDEPNIEFLAIDHINGNGKQHRIKNKITGGTKFYQWLKANNFPEGFRVLCHNCNLSKGFYGYCPHSRDAVCAADRAVTA